LILLKNFSLANRVKMLEVEKIYPMHVVDPNAEYRGVSVTRLMDRAGKEACKAILKKFPKAKKVQIFCGGGNNGGDGFALAAELLKKKIDVEVILAVAKSKIRTAAAQHHFKRVPSEIISQYSSKTKFDADILVDALLGIGVEGKLKQPFADIVRKLAKAKRKLVSLDIPTGKLKPKLVIAFHSSKFQKNEVIVPIGIPKIAETHFGPGDVRVHFPRRGKDSHKGENGKVVIVGGSRDYLGAPIFAGLGALSSGVDLVYIWVPEANFVATRKASPNFLVKSFRGSADKLTPEAVADILRFVREEQATIVLGCGLGKAAKTQQAVLEIVRKTKRPLILDADALLPELTKSRDLSAVAREAKAGVRKGGSEQSEQGDLKNIVLTPHKGELKRLGGNAKKIAKKLGVVVLEKGKVDAIHSSTATRWNDAGNAVATVGGSGDVLAGLVGSLLSRKVEPFEAAGIASFVLGIASEQLAVKSESVTPQMLARAIPKVIQKILTESGVA
jgi:ADP-dependent NAD(P)H-hydrate dehydratase / NAD(P)H-hydrate epimerase